MVVGLVGFLRTVPRLHGDCALRSCAGRARSSWLAGVALSTTSVAVVYAVMLELGFNKTDFGKAILAACFVNDLGTVIALGLIFAPFTIRTLDLRGCERMSRSLFSRSSLPGSFKHYGGRVSELEAKYILFLFFAHGRSGGLGRQRGGAACLHHRNGASGNRREGPHPGSPTAHTHFRPADAVLFHPGRVLRVRCPHWLPRRWYSGNALRREDGLQDCSACCRR